MPWVWSRVSIFSFLAPWEIHYIPICSCIEYIFLSFLNQLCICKAIFQGRVFDAQVPSDTIFGLPPDLPQIACSDGC